MKDIFYSDQSSQPEIHIVGIGLNVWTTPSWVSIHNLEVGVYKATNGMLYAFDRDKVTAPASLGWIAYKDAEHHVLQDIQSQTTQKQSVDSGK